MLKVRSLIFLLLTGSSVFADPVYELIPLYGIQVQYEGLKYKTIQVRSEAGLVYNNEIPQLTPFEVVVDEPAGFTDSSGLVSYGYAFRLLDAAGAALASSEDIFRNSESQYSSEINSLKLTLTFDRNIRPNSEITVVGRIFDKKGKGYIRWSYKVKVVMASKKLLTGSMLHDYSSSQGMTGRSIGLHYNFFEFRGKEGNKFIYRIDRGNPLLLSLRGLEGWKITKGRAMPAISAVLLNDTGKVLEQLPDLLDKELAKGMDQDKRELQIRIKPETALEKDRFYRVWVKIRDVNNPKNVLDLVIRFYVE